MLKSYLDYPVEVLEVNPAGERLIVLLHGFGASTFSWVPVTPRLAELGHVLAYDRPGFGLTPMVDRASLDAAATDPYSLAGQVDLLAAVIRAEAKGRQVVVIGHSSGGLVAAQFALDYPQALSALVLESPAIWRKPPVPAGIGAVLRKPALEKFADRMLGSFDKAGMKILRDSYFDQKNLTQQTIDGYRAPMARPDWRVNLWRFVTSDQTNQVRERLGELNLPTFLVSGDHDPIIKVEDTFKVAERIPGHRIYLVPNASHLAHEERSADWLRVVTDFILGRDN